ncbi:uncharacterized protein RCC_08137 [Ramularia collo-cygni]|uniref:Terpenoid synthase n=1 Tax=Ramularia collo-cygni TaxID=112498 RepID=A0A2D3V374_9PEZI|nr:uncharacterized protein RCC_08137 [Ramularia collo-cygni]CZT22268.1 uncharacterized protein RCC_08137 [Ramularia collo-cygni]
MQFLSKDMIRFSQHPSTRTEFSKPGSVAVSKMISCPFVIESSAASTNDSLSAERFDSAQPSVSEYDVHQPGALESDKADAKRNESGLTAHWLPKHSIPASINVDAFALHLPDTTAPVTVGNAPALDIAPLSKEHFLAFPMPKDLPAAKSYSWTIETATKEVKTLRKAFPQVYDANHLLAMCAWFHLFCFFDDVTEKMPAKEARMAMKQCMHLLEVSCQTKASPRKLTPVLGPLQRAKVQYLLWSSSRSPSGGLAAGVTYLFVQQAQRLLGAEALQRVARKILDIFRGYHCEISCRENIDNLTVDEYSQSRAATMGLSPFMEILRDCFFTAQETQLAEQASYALETYVTSAVGIQNDLVGLANDHTNGDQMNYILLRAERESLSIGQALVAAIELHNTIVLQAAEERRKIGRALPDGWQGTGNMRIYADCMVGFMTTHFLWASSAKRYVPGCESPT